MKIESKTQYQNKFFLNLFNYNRWVFLNIVGHNSVFLKKFFLNYVYIFIKLLNLKVLNFFQKNETINYKFLLIDNSGSQLYSVLTDLIKLKKGFSTGYFLKILQSFKKELKKKKESSILHMKSLLSIIKEFYSKNFFIFLIKGTKYQFYLWLNLCKFKLSYLNIQYYIYTPGLSVSVNSIKKIRSIKKNLNKKYLYSHRLV